MLLNKDRDASPRVQKNVVWVTAIILSIGLAASAWLSPLVAAYRKSGANEARPLSTSPLQTHPIEQDESIAQSKQEEQAQEQQRARIAQLAEMQRQVAEQDAQLALQTAQREAEIAERVLEIEMLERRQIHMEEQLARAEAQRASEQEPFVVPAPVLQAFESS